MNTALATVLGLMIGVGAAFLLEYLEGEQKPVKVRRQDLAPEAASDQAGRRIQGAEERGTGTRWGA